MSKERPLTCPTRHRSLRNDTGLVVVKLRQVENEQDGLRQAQPSDLALHQERGPCEGQRDARESSRLDTWETLLVLVSLRKPRDLTQFPPAESF